MEQTQRITLTVASLKDSSLAGTNAVQLLKETMSMLHLTEGGLVEITNKAMDKAITATAYSAPKHDPLIAMIRMDRRLLSELGVETGESVVVAKLSAK